MRKTTRKPAKRRRKNPGLADLADLANLLTIVPKPQSRTKKKNPGFVPVRAIRVRKRGRRMVLDVLK